MNNSVPQEETKSAVFGKSYPIKFSLYDNKSDQNVLYIDNDVASHACRLEIVNTSRQNIELSALTGTADADNHHFELKFRPSTLATDSLENIRLSEDNSDWNMSYQQQNDQTVSLYFLNTNSQIILPDNSIQLLLQNVRLDASGGARGTRVELKYKNMKYQDAAKPLAGFREKYLSIIDHQGKKEIPLRVDFVGSNTILNDNSSQNTLKLRISNISKSDTIHLNTKNSNTPSKFILSFDCGNDNDEWALEAV